MDLADLKSVSRFANDFAAAYDNLDILIANAGVMACPEQRTAQGWSQFSINHVGHFVLGLGLIDLMARADSARLVTCINRTYVGHAI